MLGKYDININKSLQECIEYINWIITKGVATIVKNNKSLVLKKDESTYIEAGDKHKIINKGARDLEILEVQTGSKISEDDIIKYDDIYGRK